MNITVMKVRISAAIVLMAAIFFLAENSSASDKGGPFHLAITTHLGDAQSFQEGDIVSFYISLAKDAYLTVIYQDAGNRLRLLIPNAYFPNNFYKAGLFIPIPNEQNPFQFRVTAPFGQETLWVFASDQTFVDLPVQDNTSKSPQLAGDMESIRQLMGNYCRRHKASLEESSLTLHTAALRQP
jgi:hypothetical protein